MTNFKSVLFCILTATGCGGLAYSDEDLDIGSDAAVEMGDKEDAITVRIGTGWRSDLTDGNEGTPCIQQLGLSTQVCNYPGSKTVRYRLDGTWTGADKATAEAVIDFQVAAWNTQFGADGWTFSRTTGATAEVTISNGNPTGSSSMTSIMPYVGLLCINSTTLTEPVGQPLPGTHRRCDKMAVTIDYGMIVSNFTGIERGRVRVHAFGAGMSPAAGVGLVSSPTNRVNSIAITVDAGKTLAFDANDACRVKGYNLTSPTTISTGQTCP